jgi:type IV secretory pathway VirB10-like protein
VTPTPTVQQKAPAPPGNIPRGRQTYVMLAVALVIVLAVVFSGSTTPAKPVSALPPLTVTPPKKDEIDRLTQSLRAEEMRARAAQVEAERSREAFQQAAYNGGIQGGIPGQAGPGQPLYQGQQSPPVPQKTAIQEEREKREYTSLFAPNVALSYRPTGADRAPGAAPTTAAAPSAAVSNTAPLAAPSNYVLFEGTLIETVLTNRLAGDFTGPVNCMVTTDAYSLDHQHLLIPQGSRVLGEARRVDVRDQQRLAVTFHRLIMPDGFSLSLDHMQGLDQAGATGLKDKVDNYYLSIFGTSIALGLMSGFSAYGTGSALTAGGADVYRQGVANQLSQNSSRLLDRQLNRLPTITIREGQRVKIYLASDLRLPEYGVPR